MTSEDKSPPLPPNELLEVDLSPEELIRAQIPNELTNLSSDATHPLTEAPAPAGASVESEPVLEPILAAQPAVPAENADRLGAPIFFQRLALAENPGQIKIKRQSPQSYSLAANDNWPVFLLRRQWTGPIPAQALKTAAAAAKRYGDNRLCLGPHNELDMFFNDRRSLDLALQETAELPETKLLPFRLLACPGLYFCPLAAKDTLTAAETIKTIGSQKVWPKTGRRDPLIISLAGCPAGQGRDCGLYEYADLTVEGNRTGLPVINQALAAQSPNLARLIAGCPTGALSGSTHQEECLKINPLLCRRCGFCVHENLSFTWPSPQGSYFRLLLAGRRHGHQPVYLPHKIIWSRLGNNFSLSILKIFSLLELWLTESSPQELLANFLERTDRLDYLAEAPEPEQPGSLSN
ncbi:MAG: hypothetical protein LBP22_13590 [Deltaproteobacteria bacterium]|jgi:dissimilatory sulfite reductase (desulfoviridin) alpha/beta subunit|nr:hypothetical protein [Deltaproteobacteria bacterium]